MLKADPARESFGLGAYLFVEIDSPGKEGLSVENNEVPLKPGQPASPGRRFNSTFISGPPKARTYSPRWKPAGVKSGKLRITRRGSTAAAWYTEGSSVFRELRQVELGAQDLDRVVLAANLGGSKHALDMRLRDLRIRAEDLPGWSGSPPSPKPFPWGIAAAGTGAFVLAGAGLWWLAASRRPPAGPVAGQNPEKAAGKAAEKAKAVDPDIPHPPGIWDEEGLSLLEARARAYASEHPDAGAFAERPRFSFSLRDGLPHGPFIVWHDVDPDTLKQMGKTWDEVRKRLTKRFEGTYHDGKRQGKFVSRDESG
ncbi:MAG: hypothetical protein WKF75_05600, partial [Singulisphaera sp.]